MRARDDDSDSDPETAAGGTAAPARSGGIPIGGIALLTALTGVFVYGIYLKATSGPPPVASSAGGAASPSRAGAAHEAPSGGVRPGAERRSGAPESASSRTEPWRIVEDAPLIPERSSAEREPISPSVNASPIPAPAAPPPSGAAPRPSGEPPEAPASTKPTPPPPAAETDFLLSGAAPEPAAPRKPALPPAGSRPGAAPRGTAPAQLDGDARGHFRAGRYTEAAEAWGAWARLAPPGSWTVQIAAVRLDRPSATTGLARLSGREGLFVLPPGSRSSGLSPVCVGLYPGDAEARRAAAATAPYPGSSSKPFARALAVSSARR